jgi:hypothetical protein
MCRSTVTVLRKQLEESEVNLRAQKATVMALQQELKVAKIEFEGEKRMMEVRIRSQESAKTSRT